ncbi:hypothetical protein [Methylobacterium oryzihabitans]|uniref:HNH nuclease domain-containing protein n=1 Tax=Methylobacterium oryzihabitans TaxID=2499852 RepID=A0A437NYY3_9HYPH|nr:hypothetical protein [Methylobacterium oryzihabitans]RVU15213.1 hypothetical protein EOE48_20615 [Methylobacterium oryzihabitans]
MRTVHRSPLTAREKTDLLLAQGHTCPLCNEPIRPGDRPRDEHMRALGLGGSNDLGNRAMVHGHCADAKTAGPDGDLARIGAMKAQVAAVYGFKQSRRPLPGGKGDWRKRKVGGGCVERATGEPL